MKLFSTLAVSAAITLASAGASAAVIDIDALNPNGTVVNLAAGTYEVAVVGTAGGGAYDAWNAWSNVSGCDALGENCSQGFLVTYAVDLGVGGVFNQTNGYHVTPATRSIFDSAAKALASFNSNQLQRCDFGSPCALFSGFLTTFTIAAAQDVNFLILDFPYPDNSGGVSLRVTQSTPGGVIPEPATWAMLITGFGLVGVAARRRRQTAVAA